MTIDDWKNVDQVSRQTISELDGEIRQTIADIEDLKSDHAKRAKDIGIAHPHLVWIRAKIDLLREINEAKIRMCGIMALEIQMAQSKIEEEYK